VASRRGLLASLAGLVAGLLTALPAAAEPALKVVASFSIIGDFARQVGGDRISLTTLVGPGGDSHVYRPSPDDVRRVADAQLVIINGLGLEGWLPRLVDAAGHRARIVTATDGIAPRRPAEAQSGRDADPHAWQSVANAKVYVTNIRDAFVAVDPANATIYQTNAQAYLTQLDALDHDVRAAIARIPPPRRKVISTHDAFGYFGGAYGISFIAPLGVSTDSEVSARDLAAIVRQIKAQAVPAVFLENVSDPRLMRQIAAETGAKVGGTLYSDSLTAQNGEAPTYIDMVRHNIKALTDALAER